MSLRARRKAISAATTMTEADQNRPKKKGGQKRKAKKAANQPEGGMRTISIGRAYLENEPVMNENGFPKEKTIFDLKGRYSKAIDKSVSKDRVVPNSVLFQHINETVAKRVFGAPLKKSILRLFLEGYSNELLVLAERGYRVKMANLFNIQRVELQPRTARNPKTGDPVQVPARSALRAKPVSCVKAYMKNAAS